MNERIVVADADTKVRRLVCWTLTRRGYRVLPTNTGDHALRLARTERPDLVILDARLPVLDALRIRHELRFDALTATIPILVLCQDSEMSEFSRKLIGTSDTCLEKPFSFMNLASTVAASLWSSRPTTTLSVAHHTDTDARAEQYSVSA